MSDPLVRIHLVSIPLTQRNVDWLQAQVDDLGGTIVEEVTTDAGSEKIATIIFDENLDNQVTICYSISIVNNRKQS